MAVEVDVSVIIPTYNRRDLVVRALRTVLAQTVAVDEILVIDDGSTDGTGEHLRAEFGDRIRYVWQENGGVSAARNHGLRLARGRYLTLLDSDDEWTPRKTELQRAWLEARPDFGMVLCDVVRVDADHREVERFHRRSFLPEDGAILKWVLKNPTLVPASVMMRREVYDDVGGFDEQLRTAEDLEFHLRVARRWQIGVVAEPLVRAMRGHDGLSALARTYDDYILVMERAVESAQGVVPESDRKSALAKAYRTNARGMIMSGRYGDGLRYASRAFGTAPTLSQRLEVLSLAPLALRRAIRDMIRR